MKITGSGTFGRPAMHEAAKGRTTLSAGVRDNDASGRRPAKANSCVWRINSWTAGS